MSGSEATCVGVFGTWRCAPGSDMYESARRVGYVAAAAGHTIVCGGYSGVMEAAARGAREAGGEAVGVTCPELDALLPSTPFLSRIVKRETLQQRAATCIEMADYSVFFPGRIGTATELMLALEAVDKRLKRAPVLLMTSFWQPYLESLERTCGTLALEADAGSPIARYRIISAAEEMLDTIHGGVRAGVHA
jgi:uncharacterized protein (TIGR00725 family)